jgi:hypothetical protein
MFVAELGLHGAENEEKAYQIIKYWTNTVDSYTRELGVGWAWKYLNYAGREQNPLSTIGPNALKKLQVASRKYDPKGVFQTLRASGFKILRDRQ